MKTFDEMEMQEIENDRYLREEMNKHKLAPGLFHAAKRAIKHRDATKIPAMIIGELGTEVNELARFIHGNRQGEFFKIFCAGYNDDPEKLLRELNKDYNNTGKSILELAKGGTIFFYQIDELSRPAQLFVRAVFDKIERDGLDIRLISSSARELKTSFFDEGLFHRMCSIQVEIPPIRDRIDDIDYIINLFCREEAEDKRKRHVVFHPDTLEIFKKLKWQYNGYDLEKAVVRLLAENNRATVICPEHLVKDLRWSPEPNSEKILEAVSL